MDHPKINLPEAAAWALRLGSIGKGLILIGVVLFALALLAFIFGRSRAESWGSKALIAGCSSIFGAFISLAALFVKDQFEFAYVYGHSETQNAIQYKIAAIWSGQQGSFLLWAMTSSVFLLLTLRGTGPYKRIFGAVGAAFLGCLCGILAYESPFLLQVFEGKVYQIPEGIGLAPSLNNYWVVIHPPTIFMGFGSLIVPFAYACAALWRRDYDDWATRVRPWAIISLTLVGVGLCMGGFWAYETLGWGGFWKWDPVENVSFVPWVMVTALAHGILVQVSRNKWQMSNLMLAGAPFLLFCYGTFLTRAGFLDKVSVHSFAQMDASAHKVLLWFLGVSVVAFLALWIMRLIQDGKRFASTDSGLRRDGFYRVGNIFLTMLAIATAIGMSVPLIEFLANRAPKVVEEGLYHQVLVWFFLPILVLMAIAPFVPWRETSWKEIASRLLNPFSATLFVVGIFLIVGSRPDIGIQMDSGAQIDMPWGKWYLGPWMIALVGLCTFTVVGNLARLIAMVRKSPMGVGAFVAHIGVAVAMAGLIVSRGFERKQEYALQPGLPAFGLNKGTPAPILELVADQPAFKDPNKFFNRNNTVQVRLKGDGSEFVATPGLYYTVDRNSSEPTPMTWPSIQRWMSHDLYVVLFPLQTETGQEITLKPGESAEIAGMDWAGRQERKYAVTYREMKRDGEAGVAGTKFGAQLSISGPDGEKSLLPQLVLGAGGGPQKKAAVIDEQFSIQLQRMNASDKSVTLGLAYNVPVFPVEVYYKPMTVLVWLGVGILCVGGLLAAIDRRRRPNTGSVASEPKIEVRSEAENDALVPVP